MKGSVPRLLAALAAFAILTVVACGDSKRSPTAATLVPGAPSFQQIQGQGALGAEIPALVNAAWPKGHATAILAKWDQVLRSLSSPSTALKGRNVPGNPGRSALTGTISFITAKSSEATPPAGETRDHLVARLVLDMSTYVYGGPNAPVPQLSTTSDVAFKLVMPTTADTVVTPALQAAVVFAVGSVSEPTVVVITPDSAYYPDNCSGPLNTTLCQYPRFYKFNVFPDVKLNIPANVQVCHVDAGSVRRPLADHLRFRVAHDKPADPANYSAGSTIVDNIEILKLVTINVTQCLANGGTTYAPSLAANMSSLGRAAYFAKSLVSRAATAVGRFLAPSEALAIDVGGGGESSFFSSFAVVDPMSKADLSVATGAASFSVTSASLAVGAPAAVPSWDITNVGSGTSLAFTSNVIVASDSALTSVISTTTAGGAASLIPFGTYTYSARNVTLPATPGTYFVGTRIVPAGFDSSTANNLTSVKVVVNAPVVVSSQTVGAAPWTGAGNGTVSATINNSNLVTLGYAYTFPLSAAGSFVTGYPFGVGPYTDSHFVYPWQQWIYTTTAVTSGAYTFSWQYTGDHSYFHASAVLEAYAKTATGEIVVPLRAYHPWFPTSIYDDHDVFGPFSFGGTATLNLTAGLQWGVRPAGSNFDGLRDLNGTITISDPVIIP
jgi:hypothetical protein